MPRKANRRRGGGGKGGGGARGDGEGVGGDGEGIGGDGEDVGGQGEGRGAVNWGRGDVRGRGGVGSGKMDRGPGRAGGGRVDMDGVLGRAGGGRVDMNGGPGGGRGSGGVGVGEGKRRKSKKKYLDPENMKDWYEPVGQEQQPGEGGEEGGAHQESIEECLAHQEETEEEEGGAHQEEIEEEGLAHQEETEEEGVAHLEETEEEGVAHQEEREEGGAHQEAIEQEGVAHQEEREEGGAHQEAIEQEGGAHQEAIEHKVAVGLDMDQLRKDCGKAKEFIADLKRWKRPPKQNNVATDPWSNVATDLKEFTLDWENPRDALRKFYIESRKYYMKTYPFLIIPGMVDGIEAKIPMALEMETDIEDRRYHVVNLKMTTEKAIAQILVVEYSGYCGAFRVLYEGDDPKLIPWCVLADHTLPDRFEPWHRIRYRSSYSAVADVEVEEGINYQIFGFLETFRKKGLDVKSKQFLEDKSHRQSGTTLGRFLFDTLYVLIAEGRRFIEIARWIIRFLGRIPDRFVHLIVYWLKSSRCIFYLYLYLLEDDFAKFLLKNGFGVAMLIKETKDKVIQKWEKANRDLSHLQLYKKGETLDQTLLYKLAGKQLLLLRNAPDLFDPILMRRAGYPGPLNFGPLNF